MGWLADWMDNLSAPESPQPPVYKSDARGRRVVKKQSRPYISPPSYQSAAPSRPVCKSKGDVKTICVTVRTPIGDSDPGEVARAHYFVTDDFVSLCDEDGKPIGNGRSMERGETAKQVAGRLLRGSRGDEPDFNRPLRYRPLGIA